MTKKKSLEERVIDYARKELVKQLYDYPLKETDGTESEPRIGIPYSKKKIKLIRDSFDKVQEEGKKKNIKVSYNPKYPNYIFFEYIFFNKMMW